MKIAYLFCWLICFSNELTAQFYFSSGNRPEPDVLWEAGIGVGAINCLTDVGGNSGSGKGFLGDLNVNQTNFSGHAFVSASWNYTFALRLQATAGQVSGTDPVLAPGNILPAGRYLRNLNFRSNITELALLGEWHPLQSILPDNTTSLSPYLALGIGAFHFNPQAKYNNVWVDLRPLHTEGQGFNEYKDRPNYSAWAMSLPVGAGIKYDAGGLVNFRLECLYRFTSTDYLDDVSHTYVNPDLFSNYLAPAQAKLATALADRSAELANAKANTAGAIRGNPDKRDAWLTFQFSMSIVPGRAHK